MSNIPQDAPPRCPACGRAYASVSAHRDSVMVNLLDNERYQRVCFEPTSQDGDPCVYFYHHTHEQTALSHGNDTVTG